MRNNILTLLVGFVVLVATVMLVKLGLDRMTDASAATPEQYAQVSVDLQRREIVYRVQPGDTLWGLADRFYGNGRRWTEIARANNLKEGDALTSGATIKIPLVVTSQPIALPVAKTEAAPAEEPVKAALPEESVAGVTLLQADRAGFPKGAICAAQVSEDLCVTINVFDSDAPGSIPVASYAAAKGEVLLGLFARDIDADGSQELFTIWQQRSGCASRVFRIENGELRLVCETPDDPTAVSMLRAK
jgi:LysM repeat protein